jgi:hypothetical protein
VELDENPSLDAQITEIIHYKEKVSIYGLTVGTSTEYDRIAFDFLAGKARARVLDRLSLPCTDNALPSARAQHAR